MVKHDIVRCNRNEFFTQRHKEEAMKDARLYKERGDHESARLIDALYRLMEVWYRMEDTLSNVLDSPDDVLYYLDDNDKENVDMFFLKKEQYAMIKEFEERDENNDKNIEWLNYLEVVVEGMKKGIKDVEKAMKKMERK